MLPESTFSLGFRRKRTCGAVNFILLMLVVLATAALAGCSAADTTTVEIRFVLKSDRRSTNAGNSAIPPQAQALSAGNDILMRHAQFYVHGVELLDKQGRRHPLKLTKQAPWQNRQVALIDLVQDADGQRHATLHGTLQLPDTLQYSGIRFSVGVPFELNHANPLAAEAPLNRSELFWAWQTGHKFLRVDLVEAGQEWSFHLGSTGCSSASALRSPATPCAQPNVIHVELKGANPLRQPIALRLDEVIASMHVAGRAACTGDYNSKPACTDIYSKTGLDVVNGSCPGGVCAQQRLWSFD